jgi:hypothetical protein
MPMKTTSPGEGAAGARDSQSGQASGFEYTPPKRPKATGYRAQKAWHCRNPWASFAHTMTRSAERRGLIVRPEACESCCEAKRLDAHHEDHRQPLLVPSLPSAPPCRRAERRRMTDLIATIRKNSRGELRVSVDEYRGHQVVNLRVCSRRRHGGCVHGHLPRQRDQQGEPDPGPLNGHHAPSLCRRAAPA